MHKTRRVENQNYTRVIRLFRYSCSLLSTFETICQLHKRAFSVTSAEWLATDHFFSLSAALLRDHPALLTLGWALLVLA